MSAKFVIPFAALTLIAAAPMPTNMVGHSDEGSSGASQPAPKPAKSKARTCRKIMESGSRIQSTRLCMTEAKWREFDERRNQ